MCVCLFCFSEKPEPEKFLRIFWKAWAWKWVFVFFCFLGGIRFLSLNSFSLFQFLCIFALWLFVCGCLCVVCVSYFSRSICDRFAQKCFCEDFRFWRNVVVVGSAWTAATYPCPKVWPRGLAAGTAPSFCSKWNFLFFFFGGGLFAVFLVYFWRTAWQGLVSHATDVLCSKKFLTIFPGDIGLVTLLLEAGADPDVKSEGGHTPLMAAAYNNYFAISQTLIRYHSDFNAKNDHGYTPMHLASWDGHLDIVQSLLDSGSLHDTRTDDKNTPLALACHGNHLRVIERLLPLGCRVNNADKDLDTPMHYCSYNGCWEGVNLLLAYGAHPDLENSVGATPLWNSVYMKKTSVVQSLLLRNVRLDIRSRGIDQHAHTDHAVLIYQEPKSVLFAACHRGAYAALKLLVMCGASLNKPWLYDGTCPAMVQEDEDMRVWLSQQCSTPRTLKVLSRNYIRARLGLLLESRLKNMEIPCTLKEFLALKYLWIIVLWHKH